MTTAAEPANAMPASAGPTLHALAARHGLHWRWLLIAVMLMGAIGTMLAATIVNVALPSIIGAYGLGQDQAQWLSTAFLTSSTACMLLNTWAVASFGVRASFIAAMLVFLAGSIIGATSDGLATLIIGRIMQGAGAGLIQPIAMVLIFRIFPDAKRGTAVGLYALGVILSPAFGPVVGGVLIDLFSWRIVFIATAPLVILAIPCALSLTPGREETGVRPPLDWQGLALVMATLVLTLSGIAEGHREGWDATIPDIKLAVGAACGLAFLLWEARHPFPILNLKLFANPGFLLAGLVIFATGTAIYGSTYLVPQFAQLIQGYSPTGSGEVLLPAGLAMVMAFPVAGRLGDHLDARILLAAGAAAFGVSMLLLCGITRATPFWTLSLYVLLSRLGIAFVMPSANTSAMRQAAPALLPFAATAATFLTQSGGALGVNGLAVMLQERAAFHAAMLGPLVTERQPLMPDTLAAISLAYANDGLAPREASAQAIQTLASAIELNARILAFRDCFFLLACAFGVVMLAIPLIPRPRPAPKNPAPTGPNG